MEFEAFLREAAPLLGLQWRVFQRRGTKRRIERRIIEAGESDLGGYLRKVKEDPEEQRHLSQILTVTISRFFRDRAVFEMIETTVIPSLLEKRGEKGVRIWSIGCASSEEPYSLCLLWKERFHPSWPHVCFPVKATDIDESLLPRAKAGVELRRSSPLFCHGCPAACCGEVHYFTMTSVKTSDPKVLSGFTCPHPLSLIVPSGLGSSSKGAVTLRGQTSSSG